MSLPPEIEEIEPLQRRSGNLLFQSLRESSHPLLQVLHSAFSHELHAISKMLEHELYFQNIVIEGDVAVAHYFYTSAYEDKDDEVEVSNGRYTDILVRTEDGWKFIAWHGGDDE